MKLTKILAACTAVLLTGGAFMGIAGPALAGDETTTAAESSTESTPQAEVVEAIAQDAAEPAAFEPAVAEPAAAEPAAVEPAAVEPAVAETVVPAESASTEPAAAELVGTGPAAAEAAPFQEAAELLADSTPVKKVAFCHATASDSNPYVFIETSVNAFFNAGHDTHQNFEDIVPPFSYEKQGQVIDFPGLNWDGTGQAIFALSCRMPSETINIAEASVSVLDATCTSPAVLVLGDAAFATWGEITDPAGDNDYSVTATAITYAMFAGGASFLTFEGELDPIDTSADCDDTLVKKVQFCHATGSDTNPYVQIETSVNAFFNAGHDTHQDFGDIVPPFSYLKQGEIIDFPGLNWDDDGKAFFAAGCVEIPVVIPLVATASVSFIDATCAAGEQLVLGEAVNATWGPITDPVGDDDYSVTATANANAKFAGDQDQLTFQGELDPALPADDPACELPVLAFVMPAVSFTQFTCDAAGSVTLGVAEGYDPTKVTFTVNGTPGVLSGTYPATGGSTVVTAQAVIPDTLDETWVDPAAFAFVIPTAADCGSTPPPTTGILAFTGLAGLGGGLAFGGGMLFLGLAALYMRRRTTING